MLFNISLFRPLQMLPRPLKMRIAAPEELGEDLIQDYYLMVGLALECALKGYLFALLPEMISDDLKIENDIRKIVLKHNLASLCHECGIKASPEELKVLDFISFQVEHGKYPAPKRLMTIPSFGQDLFTPKKSLIPWLGEHGDCCVLVGTVESPKRRKVRLFDHLRPCLSRCGSETRRG